MNLQTAYEWIVKPYIHRNKIILYDEKRNTKKNRVNLHYWELEPNSQFHNLGDWLSPIIVDYVLQVKNLSLETKISRERNLYAIGSIIFAGFQNATIWGSGLLKLQGYRYRHYIQKYDIRCVRGPETRKALIELGYKCPRIYGDPALLLPIFYKPTTRKHKEEVVIVPHCEDREIINEKKYKIVNIVTNNWKNTVDDIYNSKLVISSSLHGIILAEAYGIPSVLWLPEKSGGGTRSILNYNDYIFKYNDYYYGTGRRTFPVVKKAEEAFYVQPVTINNLRTIQQNLLKSFPYDLWE